MKRACAAQCAECPFRRTSLPGYLGHYDGPGAVHSSLWHKEPFFCHVRADYEREDWLEHLLREGQLCLGALIFIGRQSYFPKSDDKEVLAAINAAMAVYEAVPSRFDIMEPREFMEYHSGDREATAQRIIDNLNRRASRVTP